LAKFPVDEWHGGKVQYITPSILHLMRGQVFEIGGHSFFTMGGASCHDVSDGILDPDAPDFGSSTSDWPQDEPCSASTIALGGKKNYHLRKNTMRRERIWRSTTWR
jgi:hypothetical protein